MDKLFVNRIFEQSKKSSPYLDKKKIEDFIDIVFRFLFHLEDRTYDSPIEIQNRFQELGNEFSEILLQILKDKKKVKHIVDEFSETFPDIYDSLMKDAHTILENDPAATCLQEVLIAYPGFYAISIYRFAHQLHQQGVALLPRLWTEYAHSKTGIDIHPAAKIGSNFFIDHGTGIVIGETTIIGNDVKMYQGVTLGAISVSKEKANTRRHPTIEDHVVIYSGATILGGETRIGHHSIIGGNVWLTNSVEPYSLVFHKNQITIQDKQVKPEPINFII